MSLKQEQDVAIILFAVEVHRSWWKNKMPVKGSFASAWPERIIACDVKGVASGCTSAVGRHYSWPARLIGSLSTHSDYRQTDRQKDRHHNRVTYCVFRLYRRQMQKIRLTVDRNSTKEHAWATSRGSRYFGTIAANKKRLYTMACTTVVLFTRANN